jgi:PAS domain S-box-containing protein
MTAAPSVYGDDPMPDILLIEDNPLHIRLVKSMLADVWADISGLRTARRLESGLAQLARTTPDCVLLDLVLPDSDGVESLGALLAVADVPIVVLSSHEDDALALRAVREGAQDYLVKGTVGPGGLARAIKFSMHRHGRSGGAPAPLVEVSSAVDEAVGIVDDSGVLTHVQPGIVDLLGLAIEDVVGRSLARLIHPNDVATWEAVLQAARGGARTRECDVRVRHASGNDLRMRIEIGGLQGPDGATTGFVTRWHPLPPEGTASSGGMYAVVTEWV